MVNKMLISNILLQHLIPRTAIKVISTGDMVPRLSREASFVRINFKSLTDKPEMHCYTGTKEKNTSEVVLILHFSAECLRVIVVPQLITQLQLRFSFFFYLFFKF